MISCIAYFNFSFFNLNHWRNMNLLYYNRDNNSTHGFHFKGRERITTQFGIKRRELHSGNPDQLISELPFLCVIQGLIPCPKRDEIIFRYNDFFGFCGYSFEFHLNMIYFMIIFIVQIYHITF